LFKEPPYISEVVNYPALDGITEGIEEFSQGWVEVGKCLEFYQRWECQI
jgi:hypothetical protein